jgi:hypothetical protein
MGYRKLFQEELWISAFLEKGRVGKGREERSEWRSRKDGWRRGRRMKEDGSLKGSFRLRVTPRGVVILDQLACIFRLCDVAQTPAAAPRAV